MLKQKISLVSVYYIIRNFEVRSYILGLCSWHTACCTAIPIRVSAIHFPTKYLTPAYNKKHYVVFTRNWLVLASNASWFPNLSSTEHVWNSIANQLKKLEMTFLNILKIIIPWRDIEYKEHQGRHSHYWITFLAYNN